MGLTQTKKAFIVPILKGELSITIYIPAERTGRGHRLIAETPLGETVKLGGKADIVKREGKNSLKVHKSSRVRVGEFRVVQSRTKGSKKPKCLRNNRSSSREEPLRPAEKWN